MNYEELESAWGAQRPANPPSVNVAQLKRNASAGLARRSRFFGYGIFLTLFFLIVSPLLTVANYRYAPPPNPVWYWTSFSFWMVFMVAMLVAAIRGLARHSVLRAQSADTVRALTVVSLANVEVDMRDYRRLCWLLPAIVALQIVGLYVNFSPAEHGWGPFLRRSGFTFALPLLMSLVIWRDYRVNLKPARKRLAKLLEELS
jgi:hypothetical protein